MSSIATIPLQTRTDEVYDALKRMIVEKKFKPGEWLRRRTISSLLKVSPTPVVEAMRRLEQEGLVEMVPQWGARVRTMTADELEQTFHMREALEGMVFRRLAERVSESAPQIEALRSIAKELDANSARLLSDPGSRPTHAEIERDIGFHLALAEISGWRLIAKEIERLRVLRNTMVNLEPSPKTASVTHENLLDVILSGDPAQAEQAIRIHIEKKPTADTL